MSSAGPEVASESRQPAKGSQKPSNDASVSQRKAHGLRHIILNFTPSW